MSHDTDVALSFEVWGEDDYFGLPCSRIFAAFRYLLEALDYIQYCGRAGHATILRSRLCTTVNVTVYPAEKAAALCTGRAA